MTVAVVTGGAQGIGAAIADRLRADGATVVVFDRAHADPVDVTDETQVDHAVARVLADHGRIDILVNNAGVFPHEPFDSMTLKAWRDVIATNLESVFICTRAIYPSMVHHGFGRIINVSSAAIHIGVPSMVHYSAAKAGVIGLTRALAAEAGPHGITVNAITPGFIDTPGVQADPIEREQFRTVVNEQAIGRNGAPTDIAECVAYLASPAASFITGQTLNVDGGHRMI